MVSEVRGNNTQDCFEHFNAILDQICGFFKILTIFNQGLKKKIGKFEKLTKTLKKDALMDLLMVIYLDVHGINKNQLISTYFS